MRGLATRACLVGLPSCREEGRSRGGQRALRFPRGRSSRARAAALGPLGARGPRGGPTGRAPPAAPPRGGLTDRCRIALSIFSPPPRYRVDFCGGTGGTEQRRAGGQWVSYTGKKMETQMGKERQNGFQRSSLSSSESWSARSSRIRLRTAKARRGSLGYASPVRGAGCLF